MAWTPWPAHAHKRRSPCCVDEAARFLQANGWGVLRLGTASGRHRINPVNVGKDQFGDPVGTCGTCGEPCYESGDYRGGRWRHGQRNGL